MDLVISRILALGCGLDRFDSKFCFRLLPARNLFLLKYSLSLASPPPCSAHSTWNFHIVPFKRYETLRTRGTRTSVLILMPLLFCSAARVCCSCRESTSNRHPYAVALPLSLSLTLTGLSWLDTLLSATHLLCELPTYSVVLLCEQRLGAPPGWLAGLVRHPGEAAIGFAVTYISPHSAWYIKCCTVGQEW